MVKEGNMDTDVSRADFVLPAVDERSARTFEGLRNLVAKLTPWLIDVGSWIFGGLTAANLVVISALITVGPVDAAIRTSTAALAAALPLNVAGIVLLRLVKDLKTVGIDGLTLRAFQAAGFPDIDAYFPAPRERASQYARRSRIALLYSMGIAALNIALTLTGVAAAVWHMGQWIALVLFSSIVLSGTLVMIVFAHALPPESAAEKRLKQRDRARRIEGASRQRG
jgi:hypothetical protein